MPPDEARISIEVRYTNISEEENSTLVGRLLRWHQGCRICALYARAEDAKPGKPGARMPDFDLLNL